LAQNGTTYLKRFSIKAKELFYIIWGVLIAGGITPASQIIHTFVEDQMGGNSTKEPVR